MSMKTTEKINVRGAINALEVGGLLELPKGEHIPSSVRNTATSIKGDTDKTFTVSVSDELITVTRNS